MSGAPMGWTTGIKMEDFTVIMKTRDMVITRMQGLNKFPGA
jgi:hypothetical protein